MVIKDGFKGNQNALKHGVDGAIKRVLDGEPFIGLAADEEKAVTLDLAEMGVTEIKRTNAIRLQTTLNLCWNALDKALQDGDLVAAERFIRLHGWLSGKSKDAWKEVQADAKDDSHKDALDLIERYRGKGATDDTINS